MKLLSRLVSGRPGFGPSRSRRTRRRTVPRRDLLPRVEWMEDRLTLTTLPAGFTETTVVSGLSAPTAMEFAPDGRLFVLEQAGNVKLVHGDGTTWTALHLNVDSQGERGLLGIAFDPSFSSNHFVYLYYTNPNPGAAPVGHRRAQPAQPLHRQRLQPAAAGLHERGPDPRLEQPEQRHQPQRRRDPLRPRRHALCRRRRQRADLHARGETPTGSRRPSPTCWASSSASTSAQFNRGVATRDDTTVGHLIPADNPFVGTATGINQLIYVLGLRNPYTFAVQPGTGTIFINDVGEITWEEIDQSVAGGNYGWSGGNTDGFGQSSRPARAPTTTRCWPTTTREARPAAASPSSAGPSTTRPRRNSRPATSASTSTPTSAGGWIRVFDPAHPGTAANPDTSHPSPPTYPEDPAI